jgi:hypothetical protein
MNNLITFHPWCGILPPSIGCHPNTDVQVGPTGWLTCGQLATQIGSCGILPPSIGCHPVTSPLYCGTIVSPSIGCPPNAAAQVGPTGWLTCTHGSTVTTTVQPTHVSPCVGPTGTQHCTSALGCPSTSTCPPNATAQAQFPTLSCTIPVVCLVTAVAGCSGAQAQTIGNTGWLTCGQPSTVTTTVQPTHPGSCFGPTGTQHCTSALGCPSTSTCPPNTSAQVGPTGWLTCGHGTNVITAVQPTTHFTIVPGSCGIGNTGWLTCGQPSPVTTTVQPTHVSPCAGPTGTQHCTSGLGCPSTSTCPPNAAAQVGHTGWYTCGHGTNVTTTVQPTHPGSCYGPTGTQGCTSICPAQAQFPTVSCTIPVVCQVTAVAGCGGSGFPTQHCTGIPVIC